MTGTQKLVNLGLLLSGVILFLFLSNVLQAGWGILSLPRMVEWPVSPVDVSSFVLVAIALIVVRRHEGANRFANEAVAELAKVTWPNRQETVLSTGISCVLVAICSLVLLGFDSLWGVILKGAFGF